MTKETDRELLEAAAKAAGMQDFQWTGSSMARMIDPSRPGGTGSIGRNWNPLTNDGDALRLAVKLRIDVRHYGTFVDCERHGGSIWPGYDGLHEGNRLAATRHAVVRAAAAMAHEAPSTPSTPQAPPRSRSTPQRVPSASLWACKTRSIIVQSAFLPKSRHRGMQTSRARSSGDRRFN